MSRKPSVHTQECPPELDKRMLAGTSDVLEIFKANSEYDDSMQISVLAGVLAIVTYHINDKERLGEVLKGFIDAVLLNREGLKAQDAEMRYRGSTKAGSPEADAFMAQLRGIISKGKT